MATIEQNLAAILAARYGKDVRQAIHDSIEQNYEDVTTSKTLAEDATDAANAAAVLANTKAGLADGAAIAANAAAASVDDRVNTLENDLQYNISNYFPDGNFDNGSTGWTTSNATIISAVGGELVFIATAASGYILSPTFPAVKDHIYYRRHDFLADSALAKIQISDVLAMASSGSGAYETLESVFTFTWGSQSVLFKIFDQRTSGWTQCKIKNIMVIDLTAEFGAGNEPSLEQLKAHLAFSPNSWFKSTYNIVPRYDRLIDATRKSEKITINDDVVNLISSFTAGYSTGNGTFNTSSYSRTNFIHVTPNTTYIMSSAFFSQYPSVTFFATEEQELPPPNGYLKSSTSPLEFTTPSACHYIVCNFQSQTGAYVIEKRTQGKLTIEELIGESPLICEEKMADAVPAWTNLLDDCTWTENTYLSAMGSEVPYAGLKVSSLIPIKRNTQYILNVSGLNNPAFFYDETGATTNQFNKIYGTGVAIIGTSKYNSAYAKVCIGMTDFVYPIVLAEYDKYAKYEIPWIYSKPPNQESIPPFPISTVGLNSFIGAYNWTFGKLYTAKPKARIIMISHFSEDSSATFRGHRKMIDAQESIAGYWGIPICRLYEKCQWTKRGGFNSLWQYCSDGIHPDTESFPLLANIIIDFFRSFIGSPSGKKFAWYGTSIPARANSYVPLTATALGATIYNYSIGSGCIRSFKYNNDPVGASYRKFTDITESINYQTHMLDKIGTGEEPDYYVFDYGVNDYGGDATDIDLFDKDNQY